MSPEITKVFKPLPSDELREGMTRTMAQQGIPEDRARSKAHRQTESVRAMQMAVRFAVGYGVGAAAVLVFLTIKLNREPGVPVLVFLGLPLFYSVWQAARGFALMSGEAMANMTPEQLNALDPFTRALVALGKTWKGQV